MAAALQSSSCSNLIPKLAPFMLQPAPAGNTFELLAPVWWLMDGKPLGQYPWGSFLSVLAGYVRTNGTVPIACVGALCALVLLSLLVFSMWRFVRCIRVVCCQQEAYADASKVLFSKRLKSFKVLLVVIGLLACGAAAWGMISLNKDILPNLNARIDAMQEYPTTVVARVSGLANETARLSQPLDSISTIIRQADVAGIRSDLVAVTAFLQAAPSPAKLRGTLQQLSTALKPRLYEGLRTLHAAINTDSPTSQLATLRGYVDILARFDIAPMAPAISAYSDSIRALYNALRSDWSDAKVQASPQFAKLRSSYDQVDLDAWVPYIDQAVATANAINAMRTPATNPFSATLKALAEVTDTIDTIRGSHLASITATVRDFNGLWHNNASRAFQSLLDRAAHVNHTVLELPRDVESKVSLVNASLADFAGLYHGPDGLQALPDKISAAGAKLQMPDASGFIADLKAAEAALNNAQGLPELIAKLTTLARALDKTLRDAKNNIQPSLDAFARDGSMRLDLQDTLTFEGPVVAGAANAFGSTTMPGFREALQAINQGLQAALAPAKREADAIPGVLKQISEFDVIHTFDGPLQQAERVYAQFGGNPANLTKPVFEMLDRVSHILDKELVDAQAMVANASSSVHKMADSLQGTAVDGVDKFQASFLGRSNVQQGSSGEDPLQKAVHGAYYATLGAYALVIALLLLLFLMTLLNCPAGVCGIGFLLNVFLVAFAALPLLLTLGLLTMRDTCGNLEAIATKAVAARAGNNSIPAALSQYYLAGGRTPAGVAGSFPELLRDLDDQYDVTEIKERVQQSVEDMLQGVGNDYRLRPQVSNAVDEATKRVASLLSNMDSVLLMLDHDNVVGVYQQGKSFFCCGVVKQVYVQWAASIMVLAMAWVALQCALAVLQRLDTLSENCCRFRRYRSRDYGSGGGLKPILGNVSSQKALQSSDSAGSETVAVISLGGILSHHQQKQVQAPLSGGSDGGTKGELPNATPLPAPLSVSNSPPSAQRMASRRIYTAPTSAAEVGALPAPSQAPAPQQQQQQQQQQRARVTGIRTSMYPIVMPAVAAPSSPTYEQSQLQQQLSWQTPAGVPGKGLLRSPGGRI